MASHRDVKVGLLYSCLNEIVTFSAIQIAGYNQSSLNLVHICSLIHHIGMQILLVKGQITRSRNKKKEVKFWNCHYSVNFSARTSNKSSNVGDSMAYIGIILHFQYKFQFKRSPEPQNGGHFENFWNILDRLILTSYPKRSLQIISEKVCLTLMTSSVTSQRSVKFNLLYSCLNEITTFFTITIKRFDVWSPNCMCRCTMDVKLCPRK